MRLNSNGKLAKFYLWFLPENKQELPEDFCSYFWGLVGNVVLCGLYALAAASVLYWLVRGILWLVLLMWRHKVGSVAAIMSVLLIALLIWLAENKEKVRIEILSEAKAIIATKVDAVKNRYCPRIEWK